MPLTLLQFLLTIPISLGLLFSPFLFFSLFKRRPLKPLLIAYAIASALLVVFFFLLALVEHLNR